MVSRFSTIQVLSNTYSVSSRLIGTALLVRVRAETLEGYVGTARVFVVPRLVGFDLRTSPLGVGLFARDRGALVFTKQSPTRRRLANDQQHDHQR